MKVPRILLLSPVFHGYERSIARGFARAGWPVTTHLYDANPTLAKKVRHKLEREIPKRLRLARRSSLDTRASRSTAALIRRLNPDILIAIKGDIFTEEVYEAMEDVGCLRILWLYDELRRTIHNPVNLLRYDSVITYSRSDEENLITQGVKCLHVHNAFDPTMISEPKPIHSILFIGARYPRRELILTQLSQSGVPVLCVGRDWSHRTVDRIITGRWERPKLPALPDVDRRKGYALTAGAPAAINIHRDQDGFTMKTFEVPGVAGLQLVDREDVSELYDPGEEVVIFNDVQELIEAAKRAIADPTWANRVRQAGQRRTLAEHTFAHRARRIAELWA